MLPPAEDPVSEYAMIASVSECSSYGYSVDEDNTDNNEDSDDDEIEYGLIKNLYDIRGYCHFDLPFAQFKIKHNENTGLLFFYLIFFVRGSWGREYDS